MKQRRIVTPVSGALALALGISLFYQLAAPGSGENGLGRNDAAPASAADDRTSPAEPAARTASGDAPVMPALGDYADDGRPDAGRRDRAVRDRGFGEVVRFVVRERCDDEGNCRPGPVALHEYERYSIEELETIAKFDGEAAIVLADKLGDRSAREARRWALRAFVMTKDPYAYHMAAVYSGVSAGELVDADGNLDRRLAERAYVWMKTGYLLGVNDGADLTQQEIILDRHGFEDREHLDRQVDASVAYLTRKRLELTGEGF